MKRECNFEGTSPLLYLVATPIGNLKEITPRAIETLNEMDYIACEDTRVSGSLLSLLGIKKSLISCHEHNENEASNYIIELLLANKKVAFISDAGYPGISDPGSRLVQKALEKEIKISCVSGPSALLNALVASGLPTDHFYFHGFLPSKNSARNSELESLKNKKETIIFYESPHRILSTLTSLFEILGNRRICIARELTKKFEEFIRIDLKSAIELDESTLKGEMVLVVEGMLESTISIDATTIIKNVEALTSQGMSTKDAIKEISDTYKINRNTIYKIVITNNRLN